MSELRNLRSFLLRLSVFPMFLLLILLGYGTHEMGHVLAANALGVPTEVHFGLWWGRTVFIAGEPVLWKSVLIGLAGPWLVALLYGGMWWVSAQQLGKSVWELDNVMAPAALTIAWFVYGFGDAFNFIGVDYATLGAVVVALGLCGWLYGRRLISLLFHRD